MGHLGLPLSPAALRWGTAGLLLVFAALVSLGFGPYLDDQHAFRQTQTAISAYYFSGLADFWAYQTPILGLPWSVPFEFPLYQALVKGLYLASPLSLETAGRMVSVLFFLLCFWPLHRLLKTIKVAQPAWVMAPVLLAPLYVFWSRSFMIETLALFLALSFVALWAQLLREPVLPAQRLMGLWVVGALAALVKITTLLPLMLLTGAVSAWLVAAALMRRSGLQKPLWVLAVHGLVMAVALAWVAYTDAVKTPGALSSHLVSRELRGWTFGRLAQRWDPAVWNALISHTLEILFPFHQRLTGLRNALALGWLLAFGVFVMRCSRTRRWQVAGLLALYLLPMLVFINLHRIHNYYQMANGWLMCLAFGLAAYGAVEASSSSEARRLLTGMYALNLLVFALGGGWQLVSNSSHHGSLLDISAQLRQHTAQQSVIVVRGLDWSPQLPYQAQRRAMMLPTWGSPADVDAALRTLLASGAPVSAYVSCGAADATDAQARQALGLMGQQAAAVGPAGANFDGCELLLLR